MTETKEGYPGREVPKSEKVTTLSVEDPTKGHAVEQAKKQAESSYFSEKDHSECGGCGECGEE